jgi:hypothetical protein
MNNLAEKFGLVQWYYRNDRGRVLETRRRLADLGISRLRTGLSWIEFVESGGPEWFDFIIGELSNAGIKLMVMLCYTPPELTRGGDYRDAPYEPAAFASFAELIAKRYGEKIDELQLWNEPNNDHYWNQSNDRGWKKFAEMVNLAAERIKAFGVRTILGGTISGSGWAPAGRGWQPDAIFYTAMQRQKVLEKVDAVALHAFQGMWVSGDPNRPDHPEWSWGEPAVLWDGWERKLEPFYLLAPGKEVVVSETGFASYDWPAGRPGCYDEQAKWLKQTIINCPARVYWYSLFDIDPGREMIGGEAGGDPRNPYFGLVRTDGTEKPAYQVLRTLLENDNM